MAGLLDDLLVAGLIEKLDGDDTRFEKMRAAADAVAQELKAKPKCLIGAVLAGLDPDVPVDDPAIAQAQRALTEQWKSIGSVFNDPPIGLFRAILLDACQQAATERKNAAILWMTAADFIPHVKLGREESFMRPVLTGFARQTEEMALEVPSTPAAKKLTDVTVPELITAKTSIANKVNRDNLLDRVGGAVGPHDRGGKNFSNGNPHWSNSAHNWCWEFAPRMRDLLADELDAILGAFSKVDGQIQASQKGFADSIVKTLTAQRRWVHEALNANDKRQKMEQLKLNTLWWAQALYSTSQCCGYREMDSVLSTVVMPFDLLKDVILPTPASVGYLLAETAGHVVGDKAREELSLVQLLGKLREGRLSLKEEWRGTLSPAPSVGRLSLRDLVVAALADKDTDLASAIKRTGLAGDVKFTLPALAKAVFRQEQAVRLAGEIE